MGHTTSHRAVLGAVLALAAAPAFAAPLDVYYERSLMLEANARCRLFTPQVGTALDAGALQARGAALRAGHAPAQITQTRARARQRAAGAACGSADLTLAANRVRNAYAAWSRTPRMHFPGVRAAWAADRNVYRSPSWRLSQRGQASGAPLVFGLAADGPGQALAAAVALPAGQRPYAVRLVLRNPARDPQPWLTTTGSRAAANVFLASSVTDAAPGLRPTGSQSALRFGFTQAASDALSQLDPRETFVIELVFPGERIRSARLEVGDFAAARAFASMR